METCVLLGKEAAHIHGNLRSKKRSVKSLTVLLLFTTSSRMLLGRLRGVREPTTGKDSP